VARAWDKCCANRVGGAAGRVMLMRVLMRVHAKQCGSRVVAKEAGGTQSMRHQCGAVLDELDDMPSVAQAFRAEMISWLRARVITTAHNCDMMARRDTSKKDHQG
jgi:hypothetical protein